MPKQAEAASNSRWSQSFRVVWFVLVAAAYTPMRGYLGNIDKFPHPERLVIVMVVYLALGLCWFSLVRRLGIRRDAAVVSSLAVTMLASSGGTLAVATSTSVAILIMVGIAVAAALLVNRMPAYLGRFLALGAVVFLLAGLVLSWPSRGSDSASQQTTVVGPLPTSMSVYPDVFLVVLDGFPGTRALNEIYDAEIEFRARDGIQRSDAWSSYPMTIASIASLLDMGYPMDGGDVIDEVTSARLASVMSGENRFTETLDENGYRITYVESGYSRSYCSDIVDVCVDSAFLDEGTHWILAQSILGLELRERTGSAFTQGALHTMGWLRDHVEATATNNEPDFVFANVLAPHPPLFLDADCNMVVEYWRVGNSVYAGDAIIEERQGALVDQSKCVADFEDDMFFAVPDDSVLIFVSDHGGDSLGQMSEADRSWDQEDILERLNVHLAVRSHLGCQFGVDVRLVGVLRDLLWCLAGSEGVQEDGPDRMFTASRIKNTSDYLLEELTSGEMEVLGLSD